MLNRPLKIGVTGGIGSGKSIVCNIFSTLGVPVYNADIRAKSLMTNDRRIIESIISNFGEQAYLENKELNRPYLATHVFSDENKLKVLNAIVHPVVASDFESWCKSQEVFPYVIKEAALLVETGSYESIDYMVTVIAPERVRIKRVLSRDKHRTETGVQDIISNQLSDEEKIIKSNFVIDNSGRELLIPQVLKIHDFLISSKHAG